MTHTRGPQFRPQPGTSRTPAAEGALADRPRQLLQLLRHGRRDIAAAALFSAATNLLLLAPAIYMMQVYDRVLTSRSEVTLLMLTLILLGLLAAMAVIEAMRSHVLVRIGARFDRDATEIVFPAIFATTGPAAPALRSQALQNVAQIRQFIAGPGLFGLFDLPWVLVWILLLFLIHPLLGGLALLAAAALLGCAIASEVAARPRLTEAAGQMVRANQLLSGSLRQAETINAMGMLGAVRRRWRIWQEGAMRHQSEASDWSIRLSGAGKFVMLATQSLMLGGGALLVVEGKMSPGLMIACSIIGGRALQPIQVVVGQWNTLVLARLAWQRLEELLAARPPAPERMSLPRARGHIEASDVSVSVPEAGTPLLEGLHFEARPGEVLGIIGPSGSGKTGLVRTLIGAWRHEGDLRLDGIDLRQLPREEFGPQIGYLPQDVQLSEGSVAENIARLGEVDAARVMEAAQAAGAHELILRLPDGYETQIGDGGVRLSGGQRQTIGLARALHGEPALLVLDEPNAHLDEAGEARLLEALRRQRARGCSIVVVTHRAQLLSVADKVLVLRGGQQAFFGARDEALARFTRPGPRPVPVTSPGQD